MDRDRQKTRAVFSGLARVLGVSLLLGAMQSAAALVLRFADIAIEGGDFGGGLTDEEGRRYDAPSAELHNTSSYELAFIAPIKSPYHLYLRYKDVSANDFIGTAGGPLTARQTATDFDKSTFDVGVFIPHRLFDRDNEAVVALRYDDIDHQIAAYAGQVIGNNSANHEQGLWGIHAADKIYFDLSDKWQISTAAAVNILFGERDSDFSGDINTNVSSSESGSWFGLDAELALIFIPSERFSIKGGYSYSIMLDYLSQDLYAPQSLQDQSPALIADNSGEADYIEQGPFIELAIGF